ncbi:coiled-coil domain-containing protein 73 isoform X2 [Nematostella vectensis]|uniref:coiled-coil domain-containing protein 73 isoform X2 n=1 Tax=Nematostella vectensis TaxID=45351 RepID=UPI0020773060|nr:coiled-coil domain-containing protein 73 isoform X2 [Nematostella vectensis]
MVEIEEVEETPAAKDEFDDKEPEDKDKEKEETDKKKTTDDTEIELNDQKNDSSSLMRKGSDSVEGESKQSPIKVAQNVQVVLQKIEESETATQIFNDGTFVNNFLEAVEELRLRRDDEVAKNKSEKEQHEKLEVEIRKQYEERLQQYENIKEKYNLAAQCRESEMTQLKDEVRALHITRYDIEKRAKGLEREIHLQVSARKNHESQISELDRRCTETTKECAKVLEQVDNVEASVLSASRLHKKLMYTNEHHKCLLKACKEEMEARTQEVISLKTAAAKRAAKDSAVNQGETGNAVEALDKELRMQKELCRQYQMQLEDSRAEAKALVDSLKDAHHLIDRHVDIANKHTETETMNALEIDDLKNERLELESTLAEERQSKKELEERIETETKTWLAEKEDLNSRLSKVQIDYDALCQAHNSLEDENSKLSGQNSELTERVQNLTNDAASLQTSLTNTEDDLRQISSQLEELKENHANETTSLKAQLASEQERNQENATVIPQLKDKLAEAEVQVESMFNALLDMRKGARKVETACAETQTVIYQEDGSTQWEERDIGPMRAHGTSKSASSNKARDVAMVDDVVGLTSEKNGESVTEVNTDKKVLTDVLIKGTADSTFSGDVKISSPEFPSCEKQEAQPVGVEKETICRNKNELNAVTEVEKDPKSIDKCCISLPVTVDKKENQESQTEQSPEISDNSQLLLSPIFQSHESVQIDERRVEYQRSLSQIAPHSNIGKVDDGSRSLIDNNGTEKKEKLMEMEAKDFHPAGDHMEKGMSDGIEGKRTGCLKRQPSSSNQDVKLAPVKRVRFRIEDDKQQSNTLDEPVAIKQVSSNDEETKEAMVTPMDPQIDRLRCQETSADLEDYQKESSNSSSTASYLGESGTTPNEDNVLFSDEETEGDKSERENETVKEQINRIQHMLKTDRLRTNRKRKYQDPKQMTQEHTDDGPLLEQGPSGIQL